TSDSPALPLIRRSPQRAASEVVSASSCDTHPIQLVGNHHHADHLRVVFTFRWLSHGTNPPIYSRMGFLAFSAAAPAHVPGISAVPRFHFCQNPVVFAMRLLAFVAPASPVILSVHSADRIRLPRSCHYLLSFLSRISTSSRLVARM